MEKTNFKVMKTTYRKEDPATIQQMFNCIAKRYDLTNSVLSLRRHKQWNHTLVKHLLRSQSPQILVDLCAGTGDIAFDYLQTVSSPCQAYLIDFSSQMLACAKEKENRLSFKHHQISYIEADVQNLPLPDQLADHATIAYGIRNVKNPALCMKEVYRILKPGGLFGILELTRPRHQFLQWGHRLYLKTVLPIFGKWLTDNQEAYHYLKNSIQGFVPPEELAQLLESQGFKIIRCQFLMGGVATLLIGQKPS
jgi:demethylmenaquinone methyltransferase/2-methoxy-6-polyprenyl-1,4-benzoquinol methylase